MLDVLAIGEVLVDLVGDPQQPDDGWVFHANPGGAPANVAVGVSRLGCKAGFLGVTGNDAFGEWLRNILINQRVLMDFAPVRPLPTTLAFVTLDAQGDRVFSFHRNGTTDLALCESDIPDTLMAKTQAVHICSVSLTHEPARTATLSTVWRAKKSATFVSFDVNLRPGLWDDLQEAEQVIRQVLPYADLVKLSEDELRFLSPDGSLDALIQSCERKTRPTLWLVTQGSKPTMYAHGQAQGEVPAFQVKAVDTTGAGDAFVAAVLARMSKKGFEVPSEPELREILRFAHAASALCVQKYGAIPGLPTQEEVMEFLQTTEQR